MSFSAFRTFFGSVAIINAVTRLLVSLVRIFLVLASLNDEILNDDATLDIDFSRAFDENLLFARVASVNAANRKCFPKFPWALQAGVQSGVNVVILPSTFVEHAL